MPRAARGPPNEPLVGRTQRDKAGAAHGERRPDEHRRQASQVGLGRAAIGQGPGDGLRPASGREHRHGEHGNTGDGRQATRELRVGVDHVAHPGAERVPRIPGGARQRPVVEIDESSQEPHPHGRG